MNRKTEGPCGLRGLTACPASHSVPLSRVVLPPSFTLIHSLTAPFVSWFGSFLTFPLVTRSGSERSERS